MQTADTTRQQFKSPDREPPEGFQSDPEDDARELEAEDENRILCANCFMIVTQKDQRLEIQGGHTHIFSNPTGHVFEIGCFESADCQYGGEPTAQFTWFRGFKWRFAVCAGCLTHLGWLFMAPGGYRFHGLILDSLVFPGDHAA